MTTELKGHDTDKYWIICSDETPPKVTYGVTLVGQVTSSDAANFDIYDSEEERNTKLLKDFGITLPEEF